MSIFVLSDITRKPTTRTDQCAAAHADGRGEAPPARKKTDRLGPVCSRYRIFLFHSLFDGDGDSDCRANHRVVAHADKTHHLNVSRNGGGACELSVAVHPAHRVGHAVAGRTGSHIVGMERSARAAAGRDGEVVLAVLDAPFLVGAGYGVLEPCRVGGVSGDGNADILKLHYRNAFRYVVRAVAVDSRAGAVRECLLLGDLYGLGIGIEFGLAVGEAVDAGDYIRGVLAEAVEYDAERFYSDLVRVEGDLYRAFGGGKGFVAGEEAEALGLLGKEHLAEVAVAETDFSVVGNGAGNAEALQTHAYHRGGVCGWAELRYCYKRITW